MKVDCRNYFIPTPAGSGTQLRRKLIAVLVAACYTSAYANPVAPTVAAGQAAFNQQGKLFSITNTPNTIINWQSFSINADEVTRFIQQNADSKVLNRIAGQDPSQILGALQSNGKVFLINPNGVMFGKDARVDVNGLVASSLALSNADFLAGRNNFTGGAGAGKVSNQGTITTPGGGQVFLIAPSVENIGLINAPNGDVLLAAGQSVQLVDSSNPDVHVVVSAPADAALNLGQIVAHGGRVGIYGALVSQRGGINANSAVRGENGNIVLKASGTTMLEAGSRTSATNSADGGSGGRIALLGQRVGLAGDAQVDASGNAGGGSVLVGGDYQGKGMVPNAQQTYVGADSTIKADALASGDGGKVIVWSDNATRMYGALSARGGARGGNGGFIETSSHNYLDMQGSADTSAAMGKNGTLLLDPSNVYIALDSATAVGAGAGTLLTIPLASNIFQEVLVGADSLLTTGRLTSALSGNDVTVDTSNSLGTGTGFIKVVSPVSWTGSHSLTLNATTDISVDAAITAASGVLNMTAGSGSITQTAAIQVASLSATAGTNITLTNSSNQIPIAGLNAGGTAALTTTGNLDLDAVTSGGATTLIAGGDISQGGGVLNVGGLNVTTNGGAISLGDTGNLITGTANLTAEGGAALTAADLTVGSGTVGGATTLTATTGTLAQTGTFTSGGNLTLRANKMSLSGNLTGNGNVSLMPVSHSTNIQLGAGALDNGSTLGLTDAELQTITTAGVLTVENYYTDVNSTGSITVVGNLDLASSGHLSGNLLLQTRDADITVNSGATLSAPAIVSLQTTPSGNHRVVNAGTINAEQVNLFTGKVTLGAGHINASAVSIDTVNDVDIGSASDTTGVLSLSANDLASMNTDFVGVSVNASNSGSGDIVISQALSVPSSLNLTSQHQILPSAGVSVSVGGTFSITHGDWIQNYSSLPSFSAGDFALSSSASFLRVKGGDGSTGSPYQLTDIFGLQGVGTLTLGNSYFLSNDIFAAGTSEWNGGEGFKPIGSNAAPYTGVFNGNNKTITGLHINRDTDYTGLFANLGTGTIKNLTLSGGSVTGGSWTGALVGEGSSSGGVVQNVKSSASVSGVSKVGGLMGNNQGTITNAVSSGNVSASGDDVGGLVGISSGAISGSSAGGSVSGADTVGGLVGQNLIGTIAESYATGNVSGSGNVGGLVGDNAALFSSAGNIVRSYASGNVTGGGNTGGLIGVNTGDATNVYATGSVTGDDSGTHANLGGLVGSHDAGTITNAFSTGVVSDGGLGFDAVGGFAGLVSGSLVHTYWNTTTSTQGTSGGSSIGLSDAEMMAQSSYTGFDFVSTPVWRIYEGHTTPLLKNFLAPLTATVSGGGATKTYDGDSAPVAFTGPAASLSGLVNGDTGVSGVLQYENAVNVGDYAVGGLYSTKYDISYTGTAGLLHITPKSVSVELSGSKVYDTTTAFPGFGHTLVGLVGMDDIGISGTVSFTDKNVGTGKALTMTGATLVGNTHGNYTLSGYSGSADITPAPLTVTGLSGVNRVYDASLVASTTGTPGVTPLSGDVVTVSGNGTNSGFFADKNVGTGKAITLNDGSYTLGGTDAGNYAIVLPTNLTANVTKASTLSITGMTANNKVYNATTTATLSGGTLAGVYSGDDVGISGGTGSFANKNVGDGKAVTFGGFSLSGADAGNYFAPSGPSGLTANITPATLTISGVTTPTRQYDNTTGAALSGGALVGVLNVGESTDIVSLVTSGASGQYGDKNVGSGKPVTVSGYTISGTDAGNYTLTQPAYVTGEITQRTAVHWIGSGSGLWSDSANWTSGIVPDGLGNVGQVILDGSGTVTYSAASGVSSVTSIVGSAGQNLTVSGGTLTLGTTHTDTSSLHSASTLSVTEGTLVLFGDATIGHLAQSGGVISSVSNTLNVAGNYNQSGGVFNGANSATTVAGSFTQSAGLYAASANTLTLNGGFSQSGGTILGSGTGNAIAVVGGGFAQTGGSIDTTGTLDVAHTGNLVVGDIRATSGITLSANNGTITQTGPLRTGLLHVTADGDITLNNSGNRISSFQAEGDGNIALTNVTAPNELLLKPITADGDLTIDNTGGITTTLNDDINVGGTLTLTAHSPITIRNVLAANDIGLSASTNIALLSGGLNSNHAIGISAGTGVSLASGTNVFAATSLGITAGNGISLAGVLHGASISAVAAAGGITASGTINSNGTVMLSAPQGSVVAPPSVFSGSAVPTINDGAAAAAAAAAAQAAADAAAKAAADAAAADAAAKAAADAAAKAAADAAAKAAADAAAKAAADAAADAAAKAAADAAAKAAADAAAKAAADAAAKAAADAAAQAAADAAAKAAADAAAAAAAKAAADAAAAAAANAAAQNQQNQPVVQAINSTVNIINASVNATNTAANTTPVVKPVTDTLLASSGGGGSGSSTGATGGPTKPEDKKDEKKDDKKDETAVASKDTGVKKDDATKKMYCN
jgi:filamentous hemagglutinin family protein